MKLHHLNLFGAGIGTLSVVFCVVVEMYGLAAINVGLAVFNGCIYYHYEKKLT